jgi:hypothetical protein
MFDEQRNLQKMPASPASHPVVSAGQNPNVPQNASPNVTAPAISVPPRAGQKHARRPIGPRIVDMTREVFKPSKIQPPPDIAMEYIDAQGKPAARLNNNVEREFLDDIAAPGIKSIRIGYTTNGTHSKNSNHYRGLAADIDMINGRPVNTYNKDPEVKARVDAIVSRFRDRRDHEAYAPGSQLYRDGSPISNSKLAGQHQDHIHWTRRR